MQIAQLFAEHIQRLTGIYQDAIAALAKEAHVIDAILIHSGSEQIYFADDRHVHFEPFGHFRHWLPLARPDQMLLYIPGQKPTYFQVVPPDFWYEQTFVVESWWADSFNIVRLDSAKEVFDHLPSTRRIAFLGENTAFAAEIGMPAYLLNERHLLNYLDYHRGMKSAYEVEALREANRRALLSHEAARAAFMAGGSEYEIHQAYLNANQMLEHECPYTNIIALDEKAAILHYQHKRRESGRDSKVLLIDGGYRHLGYGSDITRTYARDSAHPVFRKLVEKMDALQLALVQLVKIGTPYIEIHEAAHAGVLDLLIEHEIAFGNREALVAAGISKLFFPHGIGHLLGIQVHDVGGFFKDETGVLAPPPEEHKFLRLNRKMEENMVFTIEPGLYFIPVLLEPERNSEKGKLLNWPLIDALTPCGGIRIEDNILCTAEGPKNLTR